MGGPEPRAKVKDMSSYDEYAKYYDAVYRDIKRDLGFYLKEAKKAKGSVLELGCGTGRIYLELLKNSIDAYGVDVSGKMLAILKNKAKQIGVKPNVYLKDMRTFKFNRKFDLIIIPFAAFLHMETREDQKKCLKNIHKHLKKGGRLVLDFFDPKLTLIASGKYRAVTKWVENEDKFSMKDSSTYDVFNQKIKSVRTIKKNGKSYSKIVLSLCYVFPREFMNMLELCGFEKWRVYSGYNYKPYRKYGSRLVWIAYK